MVRGVFVLALCFTWLALPLWVGYGVGAGVGGGDVEVVVDIGGKFDACHVKLLVDDDDDSGTWISL